MTGNIDVAGVKRPFVIALAAVSAAIMADLAFHQWGQAAPCFLLFIPPVIFSAAIGGWVPGIAAWGLGLGASFGIVGADGVTQPEIAAATLFTVVSLLLVWLGQRLYITRHAAQSRNAELEAERTHLRAILDIVPEAMAVTDAAGVIRFFNPAAERLFGHKAHEAVGQNVAILMGPPESARHDHHLKRYLETGLAGIVGRGRMLEARRKDGLILPIELYVGEIDQEDARYFVGFMRDLRGWQQREHQVRELQDELVHMSRLTALGEMASSLAHELNQPLSAIANYLRGCHRLLMSEAPPPPDALRDALGKAADQTLRAGNIVRSLREFVSRGDNEHAVTQLSAIIEDTSALALVGAKESGVTASFHIDPAADPILADKVQIQQVLLNLMRNAMEAMDGQPVRQMRVSSRVREDDMIEVSVADTGPGIAPDIRAKLFQPFVTSKSRGMGVGLSICRTIIEAHGGRIWAESGAAGGAVFKFTLPKVPQGETLGV